jgi:curved DNA-binding protein CbpA
MNTCECGEVASEDQQRCPRCAALHVLGLGQDATEEDIQSARQYLSFAWQSDLQSASPSLRAATEEKLKAIQRAYSFLMSRAEKRARRRAQLEAGRESGGISSPAPAKTDRSNDWRWRKSERGRNLFAALPTFLLTAFAIVGGLFFFGFVLLRPIDSMLSSNPNTSGFYGDFKAGTEARIHAGLTNIQSKLGWQFGKWLPSAPAIVPAPSSPSSTTGAAHAKTGKSRPAIALGLSKDDVIAAQGAPASTTGDTLSYPGAVLYFSNGKLSGWKIDRRSALRAKLQPVAPANPGLKSFSIGSTKNDVLAVQGTPGFYSENTFGYGGAQVYFLNDRVVGWKNDPASPPLHASTP